MQYIILSVDCAVSGHCRSFPRISYTDAKHRVHTRFFAAIGGTLQLWNRQTLLHRLPNEKFALNTRHCFQKSCAIAAPLC